MQSVHLHQHQLVVFSGERLQPGVVSIMLGHKIQGHCLEISVPLPHCPLLPLEPPGVAFHIMISKGQLCSSPPHPHGRIPALSRFDANFP